MASPHSAGEPISSSFRSHVTEKSISKLPETVIVKNDSSSDSSASNTLGSATSSSRHVLRSRSSFARRRREPTIQSSATSPSAAHPDGGGGGDGADASPPSLRRKQSSTTTNKDGGMKKEEKVKDRRRIVIGTHSFLPYKLRLLLVRLAPAYNLFMKLRARYKLCCALLVTLLYICCRKSIRRAQINYFGLHPIHGGSLGVKWDRANIARVMRDTRQRKHDELLQLGVVLPPTSEPQSLLDINTNAALREHLVRREARSQHLIQMEAIAEMYQRGLLCRSSGDDTDLDTVSSSAVGGGSRASSETGTAASAPAVTSPRLLLRSLFERKRGSLYNGSIPRHVFVPDVVSWQRPRPQKPPSLVHVTFDLSEMRLLIADNYLPLLPVFDSLSSEEDKVYLWSICALYFFGGIFLGPHAADHAQLITDMMESSSSSSAHGLFDDTHSTQHQTSCSSSPKGLAVFSKLGSPKTQSTTTRGTASLNVLLLAATPRHPHLRCVMNQLETTVASDSVDASRLLQAFFLQDSWESSHTYHHLVNTVNHEAPWELLSTHCGYGHAHTQECCHGMNFHEIQDLAAAVQQEQEQQLQQHLQERQEDDSLLSVSTRKTTAQQQGSLYVQLLGLKEPQSFDSTTDILTATVDVREQAGTEAPVKSEKVFLEDVMTKQNIAPGWLCTRCLKTSLYGTLEACSKVCNSGYENLLCYAPDKPEKAEVIVEVTVNRTASTSSAKRRIPRIVHQTWFEELSSDRYPELIRLQNSWKRSSWEYRFYTDEDARNYIVESFPSRFADAFDALIPGAYKADLFRYLVLLKEGGVYADVDILLDAQLDEFVTPSLSFFAPRDVVCEYADESFCLWNGIIGAAPGHPFIIRAVERLVNLILERADLYDMERDVCRRVGRTMENWKVRSEPLLLASGPCALGVAVNDMIGRESLAKFEIGWIPSSAILSGNGHDHGDALILVGDKFDLGSFRISDPERSYILASTDLPGVTKESRELSNPTRGEIRRRQQRRGPLPHYSEAAKGEFVWGMHNVYHDNLVNNEVLKFHVVYN